MKPLKYLLVLSPLMLAACGDSHRPVYSGHQESTEGVPGFSNGKKQSPYVKLGQSYSVDGETYVPKYEPGYTEEGLASWYGPGFHGGKTANGERFDVSEYTAAHRTLPLPSMVKVTLLSTGKSVIVRINDRGPFAKGRIIDLSRAAADKIGLLQKGTGRVRVEYLDQETKRFTGLLAGGRDPKDIDIDREVLGMSAEAYASNDSAMPIANTKPSSLSWFDRLNPIASANAAEPTGRRLDTSTNSAADVMEVTSSDLAAPTPAPKPVAVAAMPAPVAPAPMAAAAAPAPVETSPSPFDMVETAPEAPMEMASLEPAPQPVTPVAAAPAAAPAPVATAPLLHGQYYQLGAFANQQNAERLRVKVEGIGMAAIDEKTAAETGTLYVVRMGPFTNVEESSRVLAQLNGLGINPSTVTK